MRILYASSSTVPSGAANSVQVMRMCDAFADLGHEVELVARPADASIDAHEWYGTRHRFSIETSGGSELRGIGMVHNARRVGRLASRFRADLVYGRDPIGVLGAARAGFPVIYEVHHPPETRARELLERRLVRHPMVVRIVAITEALAERYRTEAQTAAEIVVAHDAADDPGPPSAGVVDPNIGYAGSLKPGKGADFIVDLAGALPHVPFTIVGGSKSEVAALRRLAPANVDLVGSVPPSVVGERLRTFSIALAPYQAHVQGVSGAVDLSPWMSPLKIFEYMAQGLPIIATDLPVLREVLTDGVEARLVAPGDLGLWAAVIEELLADAPQRGALRTAARAAFVARYTWDQRARRVLMDLADPGLR